MNNLLFIKAIMDHDWARIEMLSIVLAAFYFCVLMAVIIDLFFGLRRAKAAGQVRTSYGFRRTINKMTTYFGLLIMFSIADIVASIILTLPFFTAIGAIGIIIVEGKSVYENLHERNKDIEKIPEAIIELWKNKDDIQQLVDYLNNNHNNKSNDIKGIQDEVYFSCDDE